MNRRTFLRFATATTGLAGAGYILNKLSSLAEENRNRAIHSLPLEEIRALAKDNEAVYVSLQNSPENDLEILKKHDGTIIFEQRIAPDGLNNGSLFFEETDNGLSARIATSGPATALIYPELSIIQTPGKHATQYLHDNNWRKVFVSETLANGKLKERRFIFGAKLFDGLERIERFENNTMKKTQIINRATSQPVYEVHWDEKHSIYRAENKGFLKN